jgi:hypothetical protein
MHRYRRLYPMTVDEYLDEPLGEVEWALRIAEAHNDRPWAGERRATPGDEGSPSGP